MYDFTVMFIYLTQQYFYKQECLLYSSQIESKYIYE